MVTWPRVHNLIMGYQSQDNITDLLMYQELGLRELKKAKLLLQQVKKIKHQYAGKYHAIKTIVKENALYVWGELKKGEWIPGLRENNLRFYRIDLIPKSEWPVRSGQ